MKQAILLVSALGAGLKFHQFIKNQKNSYDQSQSKRFVEDSNDVIRQRHMELARMAIKKQLKIVTRTLHKRLMELNINHEPADDQARLKNNLIRIKCYVNHAHCALICSCLFQALYAIDSAYSLKTNSEPIATTLNAFWAELIEYVYQEHTIDDQFDVMVCEPEQLKLETFCDKLNKIFIDLPEHVKQKIQILFDRLFDRLPSSVSYKWNEAIKPQLNQVLDSNKFDSCLQLCQQDINSVLQYYLNQSTIDSGSDQLKSFRDVLNETIKHSNDILSFINQFAIDSLSFDQLFSQIFNESLVSNF